MEKETASSNFSLLYPLGVSTDRQNICLELSSATMHDLGIEHLVAAFTADREHQKEIQKLFSRLPSNPDVISYRQDMLDDLLANPELVERFNSIVPVIDSLF